MNAPRIRRVTVTVRMVTDEDRSRDIDRTCAVDLDFGADPTVEAASLAERAAEQVLARLGGGGTRAGDAGVYFCSHVAEDHIPMDIHAHRPCGIDGCPCLGGHL